MAFPCASGKPVKVAIVIDRLGTVEVQSLPVVAATVRAAGHEVRLFEYAGNPARVRSAIAGFSPDILAYSVCSNEYQRYLDINREIKGITAAFSLFGGPHPTFSPEFLDSDGVDAICRGECDISLPRFLKTFGQEAQYETPNFGFRLPDGGTRLNPLTPLVEDLDSLPFPARDILYARSSFMAENPIKAFVAGRGCPYRCTYCFNRNYNDMYRGLGRTVRTKSVGYLIREITEIAARYPLSLIKFHDDIFGASREWLEEFTSRFPAEVGLPFVCYVRPNMVTADYARLLRAAGGHAVITAIECGNEELRNRVLERNLSNAQLREAFGEFRKNGLKIYALSMVGLPGETEADMRATVELNRELKPDFTDISVFQPYPGTALAAYSVEHGYMAAGHALYGGQYTETVLNLSKSMRQRIFVFHRMFSLLVDYPIIDKILPTLFRLPILNLLLTLISRFYFGYFLHKRVYASKIPLALRVKAAFVVLFSRNRI
jgi:radical SAM superfamily enzyme YgiQ (UPF0313 family)